MNELPGTGLELHLQSSRPPSSAGRAQVAVLAVSSWQVLKVLVSIIAALTAASTVAALSLYLFEWPEDSFGYGLVKLFWLDSEQNVPTLYQCSALFAASMLFIVIARRTRGAGARHSSYWYALAALFVLLGIDEGAQLHEAVGTLIGSTFDTRFGASWAFFYLPVALAVLAWFIPFLVRLPARTRSLLLLSGALYAAGAVALEVVSQVHVLSFGRMNPVYAGLATVEEVLEMLGVALLIFALLEHLGSPAPSPRVPRVPRVAPVAKTSEKHVAND